MEPLAACELCLFLSFVLLFADTVLSALASFKSGVTGFWAVYKSRVSLPVRILVVLAFALGVLIGVVFVLP